MNCKIIKENYELEIPYYELENTCQVLTKKYLCDPVISKEEQMQRQKEFLGFSKDYKTFTPYFDFVFQKLGYCLESPYCISGTTMKYQDGYYYAVPKKGHKFSDEELRILLKPIFMERKEKYIKRQILKEDFSNLEECFLLKDGTMLSLESEFELHNFWAALWVHDFIMKEKKICKDYIKSLESEILMVYDQAELLILYQEAMQCSIIFDSSGPTVVMRYCSTLLSQCQRGIIEQMKNVGLLKDMFSIDLSFNNMERRK